MDELGLNWFERVMENFLEKLEHLTKGANNAQRYRGLQETTIQAEMRHRGYDEMVKRGEALIVAKLENLDNAGTRVKDVQDNIRWLNEMLKLYRKQGKEKDHHFEFVGFYHENGDPAGEGTVYRIQGPRP
jgi:hypothetical protein